MEERTGSVGKMVDGGAVPCGSGGEWIVSDDLVLEGRVFSFRSTPMCDRVLHDLE